MKMNIKHVFSALSAAGVLALGSSGTALAQDPQYNVDNDSGFYVGAGVGHYSVKVNNANALSTTIDKFRDSDTAWKAAFGYRFNKYLSLEGNYVDFGSSKKYVTAADGSSGDYGLSVKGFAPYVIGSYPIGPAEIFAKAGYLFYDLKAQANLSNVGNGAVFHSSDNARDFVWGGGVGYTFMQHLNVRAEYEVVNVKHTSNSDAIWLDAAWRF